MILDVLTVLGFVGGLVVVLILMAPLLDRLIQALRIYDLLDWYFGRWGL